ncbi:MAG: hypothetical protein WDO19_22490 [Bacteroidota bacterium]
MKKNLLVLSVLLLAGYISLAQKSPSDKVYPKIMGYASVIHTIVTFDKNGSSFNFSNGYTVGFPMGINVLKSDKIGFSFEIVPFIKVQKDTSKVNNVVFHPGVMFRFKHGFTFITRLAFETSGRYGVTPIFNQVLFRAKNINYFAALSTPFRAGNQKPVSIGLALQLGISF